ncbi:MAG: IS3 family transposase [Chitinophagales bacterium]
METSQKQSTENFVKEVRRKTRRVFTSEQKILIVMEAMRGESSIASICRKYGISNALFYKWNKEFMEAGKKRLHGDTERQATSDEVTELRKENLRLKEMVADLMLKLRYRKKKLEHAGVSEKYRKHMRLSASEKMEIIRLVERSDLSVNRTLQQLGINKSTFYNWYHLYQKNGIEGLYPLPGRGRQQWNSIPQAQKNLVVELALEYPELSPRELSCRLCDAQQLFISESSVYRILKAKGLITTPDYILMAASNEFCEQTVFVHQMWQTDFTYFRILGWGWYYLSTILDDYSRFIIHWELCESMKTEDVERSVEHAIAKAGLNKHRRPMLKLLSDNGACYVASELKEYLEKKKITPVHGRPHHPQTQGKIERYHRSMKNVVKLDNYYCPDELKDAIGQFVQYYNHERYHESLDNVTPADVYYGRQEEILKRRELVKQKTISQRRKEYFIQKMASCS